MEEASVSEFKRTWSLKAKIRGKNLADAGIDPFLYYI